MDRSKFRESRLNSDISRRLPAAAEGEYRELRVSTGAGDDV